MRGMNAVVVALLVAASCGRTDDAPIARPSLAGRAIDADGRPLAGAVFSESLVPPPTTYASPMPTTTDAAGDFAFPKLADGDWDIRCSWDGAVDVFVATVRLPAVDRLDFRLPDGGVIAGTLVDAATKAPIAGATLRLRNERAIATATTDAAGRFSVKTHRRSTVVKWVEVESPDAIWRTILLERSDWQCVVRDGGRQELTLEAKRAVDLTGTVTGPDGPLAGVEVHAWFEAPTRIDRITETTTHTDAAGRYRIDDVQDAAASVVAVAPGLVVAWPDPRTPEFPGQPDESTRSTSPEDGAAWVVDIEMKTATTCAVAGRVVDADGKPVAGADVRAGTRVNRVETKSGADGTFAVPRAVAGADDAVRVTARSGTASASANAAVADGRADGVELVLKSPPRVHGVVKRKSGARVPGTIVTATDDAEEQRVRSTPATPNASAVAAADGSYSLELPDALRKFDIHAVEPGATRTYVEQIEAATAGRDATLDVVLDDDATLVGRVVKKGTKEPVAGVCVCEMGGRDAGDDESDPRVVDYVDALTDADGRFKLPHVGDDCFVRAHRDGWLMAYVKHVDPAAGEVVIELPPELSIEGRVAFDDGSPAAGASVSIAHGDGDEDCIREPGDWGSTTTDADGRFALREIGAGPWTLGVRGDAAGLVARKVADVAGGTRGLNIVVTRAPNPK